MDFLNLLWPLNFISMKRSLVAKDIKYGSDTKQKLDIYAPKNSSELRPVILFWHGGSWKSGNKKHYAFVADYLRSVGAVVCVVGHPLFPDQAFPGFIDDAKQAIDWAKQNIHEYGGDPNKIFLMGHSSGAHIALIASLKNQNKVTGCISIAVPNEISRHHYGQIFGQAFETQAEQPLHYIKSVKASGNFLLIHGRRDKIVSINDSVLINKELHRAGHKTMLVETRFGHFLVLLYISWPFGPLLGVGSFIKKFTGIS